MEASSVLGLLGLCLLLAHTNGYEEEDYKRALEIISRLRDSSKRDLVDCKSLGEECSGIIPCCGTTQCYWAEGYSALQDGKCKKCVDKGEKCQRDSQCCTDLQCNKGNALWTDGNCEIYRREGECYRDGQCVEDCVKKWYETHGNCS